MHDTPLTIEPLTDFSKEPSRAAMKAALDAVSKQLGGRFPPIIDNQAVQAAFCTELTPHRESPKLEPSMSR